MKIYKVKYTNEDRYESSESYYRKKEDALKKMEDDATEYINTHKHYGYEYRVDRYPMSGVTRIMWWDEYEEEWNEECSWYIKYIEVN